MKVRSRYHSEQQTAPLQYSYIIPIPYICSEEFHAVHLKSPLGIELITIYFQQLPVWQRNYHEHVNRDDANYNRIAEYVA